MIAVEINGCQVERLRRELRRAGNREIGGVMVAENLGDAVFRLAGFSVQRSGGGVASFVRKPALHRRFMKSFFEQTGWDYARFNYFGEWHSHPLYPAIPSSVDLRQMQELVDDPHQTALFAVLLIVRLGLRGGIEASAYAFRRGHQAIEVQIHCAYGGICPPTGIPCVSGNRRRRILERRQRSITRRTRSSDDENPLPH